MMTKSTSSRQSAPTDLLSPKQYNDILEGISLKNVRLSSAQCMAVAMKGKERLAVDISLSADWQQFDADVILVTAHCRFAALSKIAKKESVVITADYEIMLKATNGFTDDFFTIYKDLSLPVNVWPFFREFVQNMLGRAGYPPFTLPLLMRPDTTSAKPRRRSRTLR